MRNSRGNALLNAIVIAGIVAAISGVIMTQTKTTDESSRAPRIRAAMSVMQAKVQALANQYTSYTCLSTNSTIDVHSCSFQSSLLDTLHQDITGAKCPSAGPCGIIVTPPPGGGYFNPVSLTFSALISYQGTEVAIAPILLQYKIPTEVLAQQQGYLCPDANPIFQGYNADGSMNCQPLPINCSSGGAILTQGTFITSVIDQTLIPNCNNLGALISCPANQYLSNYSWSGTSFASACKPRIDPFLAENYTPGAPTGLAPWVTGITTPTTLPPPPPPPPPTTTVPGPTTTTTTLLGVTTTTTTTVPLTAWNCTDGFAAGPPCNTGLDLVDSGNLSPNNPGSAHIALTLNLPNGAPNARCVCSAGVLTVISCDMAGQRYIVCQGAPNPLPPCPWPGPGFPPPNASPLAAPAPGGWFGGPFQNLIPVSYTCP